MAKLESGEAVLVHCSLVKNNYQRTSKVLFSFLHSLTMTNTVDTGFPSVEVWFTDQARKTLEIEDDIDLTLIIG